MREQNCGTTLNEDERLRFSVTFRLILPSFKDFNQNATKANNCTTPRVTYCKYHDKVSG